MQTRLFEVKMCCVCCREAGPWKAETWGRRVPCVPAHTPPQVNCCVTGPGAGSASGLPVPAGAPSQIAPEVLPAEILGPSPTWGTAGGEPVSPPPSYLVNGQHVEDAGPSGPAPSSSGNFQQYRSEDAPRHKCRQIPRTPRARLLVPTPRRRLAALWGSLWP